MNEIDLDLPSMVLVSFHDKEIERRWPAFPFARFHARSFLYLANEKQSNNKKLYLNI